MAPHLLFDADAGFAGVGLYEIIFRSANQHANPVAACASAGSDVGARGGEA